MNRKQAAEEAKSRPLELLTIFTDKAKATVNGRPTFICPLCRNGSGSDGDGITINPKSKSRTGLKCFKCGFSGSIIDLVMQAGGYDYNMAVEICADALHIPLEDEKGPFEAGTGARDKKPDRKEETPKRAEFSGHAGTTAAPQGTAGALDEIQNPFTLPADLADNTAAATEKAGEPADGGADPGQLADYTAFYKECAAHLDDAKEYLQGRGISKATAAAYSIGFCREWISPTTEKRQKEKGSEWRPEPSARVIVPVTKSHYLARAIDDEHTPKQYRKMNETGGGQVGIFNLAALYSGAAVVFITEGAFSALSIIEAGGEALALNSTSNAAILLQALKAKPTAAALAISTDNDESGERAKKALLDGLQALQIRAEPANVAGTYNDPNDALQAERQAFIDRVKGKIAEIENRPPQDDLQAFLETIQTEAYRPYKTELPFFDRLLNGGIIRQTLLLLLAAPGAGKTTLAQQLAEETARRGKPVIYLNFEMSREQMLAKAISYRLARKGIIKTAEEILQGYNWTEDDRAQILPEIEAYRKEALPFIRYNPDEIGTDLDKILQYLQTTGERYKAAGQDAPAVVIDYIHLITSSRGLETQEIIKQATAGLKNYAKAYNTFVVAIVAINRISSGAGRITLESGRDSSALEYSGDYQISLNLEDVDSGKVKAGDGAEYDALLTEAPRRMILRLLKSRFSRPGITEKVFFDAAANIFYGHNEFIPAGLARDNPYKDKDDSNDSADGRTIYTGSGEPATPGNSGRVRY